MLIVLYFCIKLFLGSIIEIFVMSNSLMPICFILNRNNYETKKQGHEENLLSVAVSTFVAHVVPAVFFYGEVNAGIAQTICVCLLNVTTALLAWKFAKSDNKMSLLIWHLGLTSLASLLLLFISLSDGAEVMFVYYFITILFILFVIFNLITIGFSFAVYSFIQDKFANKITKERGLI